MYSRFFLSTLCGIGSFIGLSACARSESATVEADAPATMAARADGGTELPRMGTAPTWALPQLDGTTLKSSDFAGKVVVVDFWATWCPPCREEIPGYIAMQTALRDQGVVIVGVSLDRAGPKVVRDFQTKMGINYPVVMGDDAIVDAFGGIEAIPTTFLIDREGKVRHRKVGAMERAEYEALVRSLL